MKWVWVHCTIAMFRVYWTIGLNLISYRIILPYSFSIFPSDWDWDSTIFGFCKYWFDIWQFFGFVILQRLGFYNVWDSTTFGILHCLEFYNVWDYTMVKIWHVWFGIWQSMEFLMFDKVWFGFRGKKLRRAHSLQDRLHLSFYSRYM